MIIKTPQQYKETFDKYRGESISIYPKYRKISDFDFDVWLETKQINLQRPYIWNLKQQQSLVESVLLGRPIPPIQLLNIWDNDVKGYTWQVIDGKQRLLTWFKFLNNEFPCVIEGNEYLFNELPSEFQNYFQRYVFVGFGVNEVWGQSMSDEEKIQWFTMTNFGGTPQDDEHLKNLQK